MVPVRSPHTSYRWRGERVIETIKWMGIIRRPWLTRASGGNLARTGWPKDFLEKAVHFHCCYQDSRIAFFFFFYTVAMFWSDTPPWILIASWYSPYWQNAWFVIVFEKVINFVLFALKVFFHLCKITVEPPMSPGLFYRCLYLSNPGNISAELLCMKGQWALGFHQNILICVPKMNEGFMGLELHEGEQLMTEMFWVNYPLITQQPIS